MAFNDPGTLIPTKNKKKTSPAGLTYSTPKWNEARGGSVISLLDPSQRKPVKRPTIAQYDGYKAPVAPYQQAARLEWERPTSYNYMKNVDMFTSRNRYASVYSLLDNPNSFKFTPNQVDTMIRSGIMAYGEPKDGLYNRTVLNINTSALDQFLRDNYRQTRQGGWAPTARTQKKGLGFSEQFFNKAAGSKARFDVGIKYQGPSFGGSYLSGAPKVSKAKNAEYDYNKMADQFAKDTVAYQGFPEKVINKIVSSGGSAALARVQGGDTSAEAISNLRQYMYSDRASYAKMQRKWLDETFFGGQLGQATGQLARAAVDNEIRGDLYDARVKEYKAAEKQRQKDIESANKTYFNTDPQAGPVVPQDSWFTNAMSLTAAGTGDLVPTEVANALFYKDVQKAIWKTLSPQQEQLLYTSVYSALQNGMPVHPLILAKALEVEKKFKASAATGQDVSNISPDEAAKRLGLDEGALGDVQVGLLQAADLQGIDVTLNDANGNPSPELTQAVLARGPLSATPLSEGFSLDTLAKNALKGTIRSSLGMPVGMYSVAVDPLDAGKAIVEDYKRRYGSVQGFKESSYEDPMAPVLDVLSVLSFAGTAARAAQVAKIAGAAKSLRYVDIPVAASTESIDFSAYNKALDDWRARPEDQWFVTEPKLVDFMDKPTTTRISIRDYAKMARQAAAGNQQAALRLGAILNDTPFGLNSAYNPTAMDRAAGFFEPRYRIITADEGKPATPGKLSKFAEEAVAASLETGPRAARIRFAGNPLARGVQKTLFRVQRGIARQPNAVAQILATKPGIGYWFRFSKALREGDPAVLDLKAREMIHNRMIGEELDGLGMNDAEQLAVMHLASGEIYSPASLGTLAFKRTERAKALGITPEADPVIGMAQADWNLFNDPSFMREFENVVRDMYSDKPSTRGLELLQAAERLILLREKTNHMINYAWNDERALRAMQLRYQLVLEAADLMPEQVFAELGSRLDRIARVNGVYHWAEINRLDMMDLPNEAGVAFRDTEGVAAEDLKTIADTVDESLQYLREDLGNRSKGATPVLEVVDYIPNMIGDRGFVVARRIRVDGSFDNITGQISRRGLVDEKELLLPEEFFVRSVKSNKPRISLWDNRKVKKSGYTLAQQTVQEMIMNEMAAVFPNARDFSDKISSDSLVHRETFAERKNENAVVSSGLISFRYQEQLAAHRAAVERRFTRDLNEILNSQAEIIQIGDFDKATMVPLKTSKVFATRREAEAKARLDGRHGSEIQEVTLPSGEKAYLLSLNYFDVTAGTLKEMRLRRVLDWNQDVAPNYFDDIERLKTEDPTQAIVVVPKYLAEDLSTSYKRVSNEAEKILTMSTDMFKVLTLSMNPRFVSQQVLGSAVMLMLAYPNDAGSIMARTLEYGTRNAARSLGKKIDKWTDNYHQEFLNHASDYEMMQDYLPRDVTENIYNNEKLNASTGRIPSRLFKHLANSGYVIAFAWEKNFRVALARKMAMNYPGFETFARSKVVRDFADGKITFSGMSPAPYETASPFSAAFKLLADPNSPYYDPMFLREVRHGTDMVAGNYRDFTKFESRLRNFLIPFYAWTRHSALYTKRMVQERPLTTNLLAWTGNYGYEQVLERGGLPEWMLGTLPMPAFAENILGLDPARMNRVSVASIMPFGTFGQTVAAGSNLAFGQEFGGGEWTDFMNPLAIWALEQRTGQSMLTGARLPKQGIVDRAITGFAGFPVIGAVVNTFKDNSQLNETRGMDNPEDILKDPTDPSSKLSIPKDKLSAQFGTGTATGLYNLFSPLRAYSIDPAASEAAVRKELTDAGMKLPPKNTPEYSGIFATINSIQNWKRKRDFVYNVWMKEFNPSPELRARVEQQLMSEFPDVPKSFPPGMIEKILSGAVSLPGGG